MFEKIKLKNLVDLRAGIGFPNKYQGNKNSNIPFYKVGDISREFQKCNFYINNADNYITAEILAELKGKLFDEGTIIFAKVGEALKLNRRIILTQKAMIDNNIFGIKSNNPCLNNKYLFYFLLQYDLGNICKTGAVPSVNQSDIYSISIPLPPTLEEQQEIVDVLDAASEIIRLRTACIESARSLIPALFQEMFGDPINNKKNLAKEKIGKILTLTSGKFIPSKELNTNGQYPVYGGNGINGYHNEFLFEDSKICIGRVGVKCGCVHKTKPNSWITDNALYINNYLIPINETYLKEALTQINLNQYAKRAAQPVISQTTIYNQYILLPRIEQQELFAAKVQEIEAYIKAQEVELENAKTMFQSLLHHSFTGELTRRAYGE